MILGYKKYTPWKAFTCFAAKIIAGQKKHTLRIDKNNRWIPGRKIQHAHGVRTKQYEQFASGECKSTQRIIIEAAEEGNHFAFGANYTYYYKKGKTFKFKNFRVRVDEKILEWKEIVTLAHNDGFETADDFFRWFFKGFKGKIIHFTDLRY